jgi:hypothetical protein
LSVGVYLEPTRTQLPAGTALPAADDPGAGSRLQFTRDEQDVLKKFASAMVGESALVERAVRLDAKGLADAIREGRNYDLLIGVGFKTGGDYPYEIRGDLATLEVFSWLFGGIPSWYVPTQEFDVGGTEMALEITDMNHPSVRQWLADEAADLDAPPGPDFEIVAKIEKQGLSLNDRSALDDDMQDYLMTIVVPPMVVMADSSKEASKALTRKISTRLHDDLKEALRGRLVALEAASPLRVVIRRPAIDEFGTFGFDLVSDQSAPLEALDVYRLASKASGAAPYRWVPTAAEIEQLDKALASSDDGRFEVELSDPIQLAEGMNVIKVRVLRKDGVRTTRTVVVFQGEGKE